MQNKDIAQSLPTIGTGQNITNNSSYTNKNGLFSNINMDMNTNITKNNGTNINNNVIVNNNTQTQNVQLLQQLLQGTMPQQQPAVSESSLRKKFSNIPSGKIMNTMNFTKQQQKIANEFAKVGYYDHYGTFHKAPKKIRPVSSTSYIRTSQNPNNLSIVDRIIAMNAKDDADTKQKQAIQETTTINTNRRAYSAGKIRPQSSNGNQNNKLNNTTLMSKKLDEMYTNNIITKLDTLITPSK